MKQLLITLIIIAFTVTCVNASAFEAPAVPESAEKYFPDETESFSEGLLHIIMQALREIRPEISAALQQCGKIILTVLIVSILHNISSKKHVIDITATVILSIILIEPSGNLIQYAIDTVTQLCEYAKLLLPVMTAALAAQGGVTTASALCASTLFFISFLSWLIGNLLLPMIYICISVSIAKNALGENLLEGMHKLINWCMSWTLKILLYIFTGYLSVTGVVSGTVDAQSLKAAKITIAGFVPVVGSIVSDASEAILVSASIMKNSVGIYGLFAILSLWLAPFLKIGVRYLLLKATAGICDMMHAGSSVKLIKDFTSVNGFLLGITASVCVLLLISCICFMKGVG